MTLTYIYFDLDNTLLDHNQAETKSHEAIFDEFPILNDITLNRWLNTYKQVNHNLWVEYQDGKINREQLHFSRFHNTMEELNLPTDESMKVGTIYMQKYHHFWCWIDQAEETLLKVSDKYNVGIITNGFKETQHKKFDKLSIEKYTDRMIISEELGVLKPHPKVFDYATELAGVPREEILYVGDSHSSDIVGGFNAGWKTAWYNGNHENGAEEPQADLVFDDFNTLQAYLDV